MTWTNNFGMLGISTDKPLVPTIPKPNHLKSEQTIQNLNEMAAILSNPNIGEVRLQSDRWNSSNDLKASLKSWVP